MDIRINKEIRDYAEDIFMGLSLRQCIFSVLACGAAGGLFIALRPYLGVETCSWVCMVAAAPFAVLGFVRYNGMPAERFLLVWFRFHFRTQKRLTFHGENLYYDAVKNTIACHEKEMLRRHD